MKLYVKILILNLILSLAISNIAFAEEIATKSEITNQSVILYSFLNGSSDQSQSITIPPNSQVWNKETVDTYLRNIVYWSSWTWIDHGNYFSVYFYPNCYYKGNMLYKNYDKSEFGLINATDNILMKSDIIKNKGYEDITKKILIANEYYVVLMEDNGINIYPKF